MKSSPNKSFLHQKNRITNLFFDNLLCAESKRHFSDISQQRSCLFPFSKAALLSFPAILPKQPSWKKAPNCAFFVLTIVQSLVVAQEFLYRHMASMLQKWCLANPQGENHAGSVSEIRGCPGSSNRKSQPTRLE